MPVGLHSEKNRLTNPLSANPFTYSFLSVPNAGMDYMEMSCRRLSARSWVGFRDECPAELHYLERRGFESRLVHTNG